MVSTPSARCPAGPTFGATLFRYRSYTLVPLALLLLLTPWVVPPLRGTWLVWTLAVGGGLVLLSVAIRFHVSGCSPRGTSTRGKTIGAARLITGGCYSRTRNPLYLANACVWVGATVLTGSPILVPFVIAVLAVQYRLIIGAEERYLRGKFGAEFAAYCRNVPRFFPRPRAWPGAQATLPFRWKRAVYKEHDTLFAAAAVVVALLTPAVLSTDAPVLVAWWFAAFATLTLVWLAVKALKKRSGRAERRAQEQAALVFERRAAAGVGVPS